MTKIPTKRAFVGKRNRLEELPPARRPPPDRSAASERKWPRWRTWAVAVGSSLVLWAVIIILAVALFA